MLNNKIFALFYTDVDFMFCAEILKFKCYNLTLKSSLKRKAPM
jgi:hypothetical protein